VSPALWAMSVKFANRTEAVFCEEASGLWAGVLDPNVHATATNTIARFVRQAHIAKALARPIRKPGIVPSGEVSPIVQRSLGMRRLGN
jgi:hypothetical protein